MAVYPVWWTRKIEPGDGIEAKTYGNSYKMNPNVSIDSTLKSLEEWLSKKPYGKEGYILAVKSFELFTKTFSMDAEKTETVKCFLSKMAKRFNAPQQTLKNAGIIDAMEEDHLETLTPCTMILFKNSDEWWTGVVKGTNKSKSTKILLIRDDLCFDQTTFLKKTQNFKLNKDFTREISGSGNKLSLDNVEEMILH